MTWQRLMVLLLVGSSTPTRAAEITPPAIQWQRSYGGTNLEFGAQIRLLPNGGYIIGAISGSEPSGNKTSPWHGSYDMWLLRLDPDGEKVWERTFGGTNSDFLNDLLVTADGGFVLVGYSDSPTNALKSASDFGGSDIWMLRLDSEGRQLWDRSYGGTGFDEARSVIQMRDGGFAIGGSSFSPESGNKSSTNFHQSPFFGSDAWIIRTDPFGNVIWDRVLGGTASDFCWSLLETTNGGLIAAMESRSAVSGNKTNESLGGYDFWIVRLDSTGEIVDQKVYGGTGDESQGLIRPTTNGGFILAGNSKSSPDAGKTAPFYGGDSFGDYWLVKLDASGNQLWDRSFGGDKVEILWDAIVASDGSIAVCGTSYSGATGNKSSPSFGSGDAWVLKLDANGNKLWELCLGGSGGDGANSIQQTRDGGFIIAGSSSSNPSGNKSSPAYGNGDLWIIKLSPDALTVPQLRALTQSAESIRTSGFRLEAHPRPSAPTNAFYILEASTNMTNWTAIQTNQISPGATTVQFVDLTATNRPSSFYRVRVD